MRNRRRIESFRDGVIAAGVMGLVLVVCAPAAASTAAAVAPPAQHALASGSSQSGTSGSHADRLDHPVVITELAPGWMDRSDASFVELQNVSTEPVDLTGWNLYRCNEEGLRAKRGISDADFTGVVLQPGEHYLLARSGEKPDGASADESLFVGFGVHGIGYVLEDADQLAVDRVAVYPTTPWMMTSECDPNGSLPNTLDIASGESWQRFGATPADDGTFEIALATPGAENRRAAAPVNLSTGVVISEVAPFGPRGSGDDLLELRNDGDTAHNLEGWSVWRCTSLGVRSTDTRQLVLSADALLAPGERLVIGGPGSAFTNAAATMATSLADTAFGVQVRDARGALVDEVASAHQRDSACQSGAEKLPARLDPVRAESHQRVEGGDEWIIAPRTPGVRNADEADALADAVPLTTGIVVSELATDPLDVAQIARPSNFVEIANRSSEPVDVSGWSVWACRADGVRQSDPLVVFADGTELATGAALVIAANETATPASARYAEPLHFLGTGVVVLTEDGEIADRVGVFHVNEMDESIEPPSVCTNAVSLVTFQPDRLLGESYQRVGRTGVDLDDFRTAPATPGIDVLALARATPSRASTTIPRVDDAAAGDSERAGTLTAGAPRFEGAEVIRAAAGTVGSEGADGWWLADEHPIVDAASEISAEADGWSYPAVRLEFDQQLTGAAAWSGVVSPRHRVTLSRWHDEAWVLVGDALASATGEVEVGGVVDGARALLVQVLPAPRAESQRTPDGSFEHPDAIDATIVHLTDTQYLAEGYPEEYERMASWVVDLSRQRDVAAVVHTGDLTQSWVDPDQGSARARIEFERAAVAQGILESAGLVTTTLPGNHDTKRGIDTALYNEFFGPTRYEGAPGFVAPIAPDDATSSYTIVDAGGAPVLVLSIGYGYGERELLWAEQIVAEHADHNIIIATHEHLTPLTLEDPARRATANRWLSRADELWERVIEPNRHVVAVLAGHYHGLGAIVTPDAGGIEGHDVVELLADYQEFRTDSGERATGFMRLLQLDLAAGVLAVDTYSPRLDARVSAPYDAVQFRLETGSPNVASNGRPWNIIAVEREDRYGIDDDEFTVDLALQYEKALTTTGLAVVEQQSSARSVGSEHGPPSRV